MCGYDVELDDGFCVVFVVDGVVLLIEWGMIGDGE